MEAYTPLSIMDLFLAAALIFINAVLSIAFRLGLERILLISVFRMVVQLLLIGMVLKFIFESGSIWFTLLLATVMIGLAGYEVMARQSVRMKGWLAYGLSTTSLLVVGLICTVYVTGAIIQADPWYSPRYVLPILGMVLGNSMTGIALGMETLNSLAKREQKAIEFRLALGQTRFEALSGIRDQALKTGMIPIINAMSASGVVSLPGMMTGQILAGVDPVEATKYQILIMFMIAGATALATLITIFGGVYFLTDDHHRLRLDRLAQ